MKNNPTPNKPSEAFKEYCLEKWAEEYTMQAYGRPMVGLFLASFKATMGVN